MKKIVLCFLLLLTSVFVNTTAVEAKIMPFYDDVIEKFDDVEIPSTDYHRPDNFNRNCADFASTIKMAGVCLFFAKIILPLIIIATASINMMKVVSSGKQDEIMKQAKKAGVSLIGAILVFFLPTIIYTIYSFIDNFEENRTNDSKICYACVFKPYGNLCTQYATYYKE